MGWKKTYKKQGRKKPINKGELCDKRTLSKYKYTFKKPTISNEQILPSLSLSPTISALSFQNAVIMALHSFLLLLYKDCFTI